MSLSPGPTSLCTKAPLSPENIRRFRRRIFSWFSRHGRLLPWRTTYNPYHILVSEIMLQQTQVERVIDKFTQFTVQFPTIEALADAPLTTLLTTWQGLGYNRRAVALRESTRRIISEFHGALPDEPELLRQLPGIGPATAASIAAFAFNKPTLFLETNIRTVFIYHFFRDAATVADDDILPYANATLSRRSPRKWYSALMDYGTVLKKEKGNLTRNSNSYKKQSPFEGSRRQLRGALLRHIIRCGESTAAAAALAVAGDRSIVTLVLDFFVNEGTMTKKNRRYRIAR